MSHFRTELHIDKNPDKIKHDSKIMSIGSGFSNEIVRHLESYGFDVNSNPYGTTYNPISIFNLIDITTHNKVVNENLISKSNDQWNHYDFNIQTNAASRKDLREELTQRINNTHDALKKTNYLILTFGSAYVYKLVQNQHVVANCHKSSTTDFKKELLTPQAIVDNFRKVYRQLNNVDNIILLVSPVMHTNDSITLNAVSKSVLRLACHQIMAEFPYVKYFPAYEFLLSDLRDYRFYEKDLIHPSQMAMDYIFGKFVDAYVDEDERKTIARVEDVLADITTSPYNPQSESYQQSISDAQNKLRNLDSKLNLSALIENLE
ncbi:MAG: GSCFA domain-containing protein [Cyclobacteriaceae bacterium]